LRDPAKTGEDMAEEAVWSDEARSGLWHLGEDDSGRTMCGMNTEYLKREETPWSDVATPCGMCRWLADQPGSP
jgi:hypothetical protein